MRKWDLVAGAARLELAYRNLMGAWEEAREQWDDAAADSFQQRTFVPLEPRVKRALETIKHLSGVLSTAEHDIEPQ